MICDTGEFLSPGRWPAIPARPGRAKSEPLSHCPVKPNLGRPKPGHAEVKAGRTGWFRSLSMGSQNFHMILDYIVVIRRGPWSEREAGWRVRELGTAGGAVDGISAMRGASRQKRRICVLGDWETSSGQGEPGKGLSGKGERSVGTRG